MEGKLEKLDFVKIKTFCSVLRETKKKEQTWHTQGEYVVNHKFDKKICIVYVFFVSQVSYSFFQVHFDYNF